MLVTHTLKRAAGIGHVDDVLLEQIEELADAFVIIIVATGFLDVSLPVALNLLFFTLSSHSYLPLTTQLLTTIIV
jgi:hypothetical protein